LEITFGERTLKIRVLNVQEHVAKASAAELYEVVE
jgi:ribosomal 50S subunit-recycling heat shock protein